MTGPGNVAVVGGGSWGTALALHLSRVGFAPRLWVRTPELAEVMRARGENPWYLAGIPLPPTVAITSEFDEALEGAGLMIFAVPSHGFAGILADARPAIPRGLPTLSATKGLDAAGARRMSEILSELIPDSPVAVLSGPTFAREVALSRPTAAVIAASDSAFAGDVQRRLSTPVFRLYTNRDVLGVELGGALKNVVAIATGLSDGLGLGENARAALVTRGLAEITRLGVALGASPLTFSGLAGMGDLVLTCTGSLSRNRALGLALGSGKRLADVQAETRMVAEGVRTTTSALELARRTRVTLPICQEVGAVLFEGKPPRQALTSLLERAIRPEEEPELQKATGKGLEIA